MRDNGGKAIFWRWFFKSIITLWGIVGAWFLITGLQEGDGISIFLGACQASFAVWLVKRI